MIPNLINQTIHFLPKLLLAFLSMLFFWLAAKAVSYLILQLSKKRLSMVDPTFVALAKGSKILINSIGFITAMGTIGININALVTSLGLGGLALTLATKDSIANFLAGMTLIFHHPFQVRDTLKIGDLEGEVTDISLRYTHLAHEGKEILVPNASLLTNSIVITRAPDSG